MNVKDLIATQIKLFPHDPNSHSIVIIEERENYAIGIISKINGDPNKTIYKLGERVTIPLNHQIVFTKDSIKPILPNYKSLSYELGVMMAQSYMTETSSNSENHYDIIENFLAIKNAISTDNIYLEDLKFGFTEQLRNIDLNIQTACNYFNEAMIMFFEA